MKPTSLYIHVPFCARRCSYCDFAVSATREPPVAAWLDSVSAELEAVCDAHRWDVLMLDTLYIGGGTPSLLGADVMAALRRALEPRAVLNPGAEWTAEANPESFDADLAAAWRTAGVNRISLGAQSFQPAALRWMGRLHGEDGPARAVAAARAAGIEDVSIDLIFALPARLERDWAGELDRALALEPSHISLYGLTAEEATPLGRWVREGRETMADESTYEREYLLAAERLSAAGFEHYEVSNFALPGRRSRHNSVYWQGDAYLGLGPSAHSFLPPMRSWNARDWLEYRNRVARGESATADEERVAGRTAMLERVWLALRTAEGLPLREVRGDVAGSTAAAWTERGWAVDDGARLALTARGWLLLDRLAIELTDALERDRGLTLLAGDGHIRRPMQTEGAHG